MITSYSLEEILEKQCKKLENLETTTVFIKIKDEMKKEFLEMRSAVSLMCNGIESMRQQLNEMRRQNNQCKELSLLIKSLDKKVIHMERNVPPELIYDYHNSKSSILLSMVPKEEIIKDSQIIINTNVEKQETSIRDCKKILFNEPEICPVIPLISKDEFNKVPKYIIGRQSLETVNNLISTINRILKAKYTFLSLGKAHARKQGDLSLYLHYKKQELDVCNDNEYEYFFTAEDYEKQTKSKLNKIKLNLMIVLRHCKRLREHRVKNNLHYVILKKE